MVDPATVPIQPAATVMIVDDRPDLQVLMVRRAARLAFAADSWVFPGGRVDPGDLPDDIAQLCRGMTDTEASQILDVDAEGLAWWMAVCRETYEETGLLLADPATNTADGNQSTSDAAEDFPALLRRRELVIDAPAIQEVARFITPLGPPRRYDARFFVTRLTSPLSTAADADLGSLIGSDHGEVTDCQWFKPSDALTQWRAGTLQMMSPTVRMLACLERHETAQAVMDQATQRLPYQRVRVEDPNGEYRVLLPGEDGYENAELEVESGWVRLWPNQSTDQPETDEGL